MNPYLTTCDFEKFENLLKILKIFKYLHWKNIA